MKSELSAADYDALFKAMRRDIPEVWRDVFPDVLAQLEAKGALIITQTRI